MRLRLAFASALASAFASALLAATPVAAQLVTIPFGGPRHVKPSASLTLRGSPADVAGAVAMKGRPVAMADLDDTRRPVEVLRFLGLSLGARVLDAVAGTGYYSEIIGTAVGSGGSVAALVAPAAMTDPATRAAISGVVGRAPNVAIVVASPATARFAADRFDFVLLQLDGHDRYREAMAAGDPVAFLRKIYAAVRPGGIVGVVDNGTGPDGTSEAADPIDPATVRTDFARAGFVLDGESNVRRLSPDDRGQPPAGSSGGADRFVLRFHKTE